MPESFIAAIIVLVIAAVYFAFSKKLANAGVFEDSRDSYSGRRVRNEVGKFGWTRTIVIGVALLAFAGLLTVNASFNTVPVRNTGIVTAFNKPTGETTGPGVSWVAPYEKIEEWDANYELWDHRYDNPDEAHPNGKGMLVKIAGNQDAYVPVSVEYAPDEKNASKDFTDYARNRDNWIERRVYPTLDNAVSTLFRNHDPLAKANVDPVTGQVNPPDMTPYKNELNNKLKLEDVGFRIRNLYIGTIVYSAKTTESLQTYANLVLENRNLTQQEKNQTLKNNITNKQAQVDPLTYCLQIQEKTGTLCLLAGSGSNGVIVDGTKK